MRLYSEFPEIIGHYSLQPEEFCYVVYMPIRCGNLYRLPQNLVWTAPLFDAIKPQDWMDYEYFYLTAKHMWVDGYGNRPGWHIDGFGSDDVNYIWSDCNPTEFCLGEFDLTDDHEISLKEMEKQANTGIRVRLKGQRNQLLRLTTDSVHRCTPVEEPALRTFVKISCSNSLYNLKGNASNPMLYIPELENRVERNKERNHPTKENQ